MIYNSIYETIGNTPILKLNNNFNNSIDIYAKLEYFNPAGSIKDRIALSMINNVISNLNNTDINDIIIVEPTSGNTGIGIAMICSSLGIKSILVMPETMSIERRKIISAYGSEIILTPANLGMKGSIDKANEIANKKNHILLSQFDNNFNVLAHKKNTSLEIIEDFKNIGLDVFISGIGTGGTITGTSKILKEYFPDIKIIGVEPTNSPFLSKGTKGSHKIQGIGAGFKPSILDLTYIDEIVTVDDEDAFKYARKIAKEQGVLVGISSGASYKVALDFSKKIGENKNILFIAPDNGERYLSTDLYKF